MYKYVVLLVQFQFLQIRKEHFQFREKQITVCWIVLFCFSSVRSARFSSLMNQFSENLPDEKEIIRNIHLLEVVVIHQNNQKLVKWQNIFELVQASRKHEGPWYINTTFTMNDEDHKLSISSPVNLKRRVHFTGTNHYRPMEVSVNLCQGLLSGVMAMVTVGDGTQIF